MTKTLIYLFLILLLFSDIGYSFLQYYHTPFDGDMAGGIVPEEGVKLILKSPLGLKVFKEDISYPNPNRFFCHWSFFKYFNNVPLWLHSISNPIESAYLACAIAKTIIHIALIILLGITISGTKVFSLGALLSMLFISPLFQTNGYCRSMGIIDPATTYTFFYVLPIVFLLIYFLPLFLSRYYGLRTPWFKYVKPLWVPLAGVVCLSGPLNPGISLVILLLGLVHFFLKNTDWHNGRPIAAIKEAVRQIPKDYYFYFLPIGLFSVYSLYLGRFDYMYIENKMPLSSLYLKLPKGIYYSFFQKLGFPVLFISLTVNAVLIKRKLYGKEGRQILSFFKWIGVFSLVYILLLPLGGYRDWRPYVIRYDTIMPITLGLMFVFGKTTLLIFNGLEGKWKAWHIFSILLVLFVFINSDKPGFDENKCERAALAQIAQSAQDTVEINGNCTVLSWKKIEFPEESKMNIELLKKWGIIKKDKLYYHNK